MGQGGDWCSWSRADQGRSQHPCIRLERMLRMACMGYMGPVRLLGYGGLDNDCQLEFKENWTHASSNLTVMCLSSVGSQSQYLGM